MPVKAKYFIGLTIAAGSLLIADSLTLGANFANLPVYVICFALALLTSTLKVRLPGLTGTISVNFLFILMSIAAFSSSETVLMAAVSCLVQCLWNTKRRPKVLQVSFNAASLALSSGLAYRASHFIVGTQEGNLTVLLTLASVLFFIANTLLISGVLALVESKNLLQIWRQCYLWTLPYYLVGATIAGMIVSSSQSMGWTKSLLILPLMYLVFVFYRTFVERMGRTAPVTTS